MPDLYVTTAHIPRSSISDIPYGVSVTYDRVEGWQVFNGSMLLAGVEAGWLVIDIDGHELVNTRPSSWPLGTPGGHGPS